MDIFNGRNANPMLIAEIQEPFDSSDFIYELKLDGERCLAYLDKNGTALLNKRGFILNNRFPELADIHKAIKDKCILDGEIAILVDSKPDFSQVQRRSLMTNKFKIDMEINKHPACFTAFDILYLGGKQITDLPLMERKKLLKKVIRAENDRFAMSRYIEGQGKALYEAAEKQELEGVVAKRKDSPYLMGKRTKDWVKFKRLFDDDFVVLGYIEKANNVVSIILGQYNDTTIKYKGHVTLGVSREDFGIISHMPEIDNPFPAEKGNEDACWILPELVCAVQWMPRKNGALNQPVYKGLRDDKAPEDCKISAERA